MKTILLGDTHGRTAWKEVINQDFDRIVFIGDYFDSFDISIDHQIENFIDIIEYKQNSDKEVVMLIGNHDHHYFREIGDSGTSGYQRTYAYRIGDILEETRKELQMSYAFDNVLCTHAGVSLEWLEEQLGSKLYEVITHPPAKFISDFINTLPLSQFTFHWRGIDGTGNDTCQTPIWIRPESLIKGSRYLKEIGIVQVVGHTQMKTIDQEKFTGGKYWFIDAIGSGQYLILEDKTFKPSKL